jgi:hypothetical protein
MQVRPLQVHFVRLHGMTGIAVLKHPLAPHRVATASVCADDGDAQQKGNPRDETPAHCDCRAVRITISRSAPDSGSQTSPGRPRIWRTLASASDIG